MKKAIKAPGLDQAPKPLTKEEREAQIIRFLSSKREQFFQMFSGSIAHGLGFIPSKEEAAELVDRSFEMADSAIDKLFQLPKQADEAEKKDEAAEKEGNE